jgi:hypothetical protein
MAAETQSGGRELHIGDLYQILWPLLRNLKVRPNDGPGLKA